MTTTRFTVIYAPELYDRLRWFSRLRWLAVLGLTLTAVFGPAVGLVDARPALFFVAGFVALYNVAFQWRLRARTEKLYENLRACAIRQMVMDLAALCITVHFTGGMQSPLLVFFVFHMAIGTVMIRTSLMYALASATSVAIVGLYLFAHLDDGPSEVAASVVAEPEAGLYTATLIIALYTIVYLTDTVMSSFKRHSIKLYETTTALADRTEELGRLLREMEDLEQRKSHYMKISAHQLRSPLGTIRTSLEVLSQGVVAPDSERGQRMLEGAIERVDGLLSIVSDLLELAKVREGRARAPWARDINLAQILTDLVDSLSPRAEASGIVIRSELDERATLAWAVPPDLVHALGNLVGNAIAYSHPGGDVDVTLKVVDSQAEIHVLDRGIGIPEEFIDQVFLEFVRAPNSREFGVDGTGLGLSIAREVFDAHGGTIRVRNRDEGGCDFRVVLPLDRIPPEVEKSLHAGNALAPDSAT